MNADGSNAHELAFTADGDADPAWHPDGTKLAFDRWNSTTAESDIYIADVNGTTATNITAAIDFNSFWPTWSPSGDRLAFTGESPVTSSEDIFVVRSDGTGLRNITSHPAADFWPDWSPRGDKIAYTSDRKGPEDIWLIRADGSRRRVLTPGRKGGSEYSPAWLPSGRALVIERGGNDVDYNLFRVTLKNPQRARRLPAKERWSGDYVSNPDV